MPKNLSRKKTSPKKDFFYWLPLITSIVVSFFWIAYGAVLGFVCFFSAAVAQNYGLNTLQVVIQFTPLIVPALIIIGTTFLAVRYQRKRGSPFNKILSVFSLISLFFAIYVARVFGILDGYFDIKPALELFFVTDLLWVVSLLLSSITGFALIFRTK